MWVVVLNEGLFCFDAISSRMWRIILDRSCGNIRTKFDDPWTKQSVVASVQKAAEGEDEEDFVLMLTQVRLRCYYAIARILYKYLICFYFTKVQDVNVVIKWKINAIKYHFVFSFLLLNYCKFFEGCTFDMHCVTIIEVHI